MADTDPREVYLKGVRLSYPHLHEKQKATDDAKPKFSATFLIDPSTKIGKMNIAKIEKAMDAACEMEFKKPRTKMRFKDDRCCFKDGNDCLTQNGDIKAGYEDMMAVSSSNPNPFTILGRNKKPVDPDNSPFYGGCIVEGIVRFYGTKNGGAPGLFASMEAIRFWDDGEHFGSPPVSADAFDDDDDEGGFGDDDDDDMLG